MKKLVLALVISCSLCVQAAVLPETVSTVLEVATNTDETKGGYTLVLVVLLALLSGAGVQMWRTEVSNQKALAAKDLLIYDKDNYIRAISVEAIGAVSDMKAVLNIIKTSQSKLESDNEKIKEGILEIKINTQ
jgi:hypothetical protein